MDNVPKGRNHYVPLSEDCTRKHLSHHMHKRRAQSSSFQDHFAKQSRFHYDLVLNQPNTLEEAFYDHRASRHIKLEEERVVSITNSPVANSQNRDLKGAELGDRKRAPRAQKRINVVMGFNPLYAIRSRY